MKIVNQSAKETSENWTSKTLSLNQALVSAHVEWAGKYAQQRKGVNRGDSVHHT